MSPRNRRPNPTPVPPVTTPPSYRVYGLHGDHGRAIASRGMPVSFRGAEAPDCEEPAETHDWVFEVFGGRVAAGGEEYGGVAGDCGGDFGGWKEKAE